MHSQQGHLPVTLPCSDSLCKRSWESDLFHHSSSDRQIWCDVNVAGSLFPGTQWHSCFLQFRNCSGLITKPVESGKDLGLVLGHIYQCTWGKVGFFSSTFPLHPVSFLWDYELNFPAVGTSIVFLLPPISTTIQINYA